MPRILVADDAPALRVLIEQALRTAGYDVLGVSDGLEAIAAIERGEAIDCIVTDHAMPGATGLEVIARMRRRDATVPCVIVTAFHDLDLAVAAIAEGADGFLPKPFRPQHLVAIVERALERRRAAEEATRLRLIAPLLERFTMLLANAVEARDAHTAAHCERLVSLADRLATRLGLEGETAANVRLGACLHDIGKIGVPDELLRTSRALHDDEWLAVRRHSVIGAEILDGITEWRDVRDIVLHHHERFDGRGYPDRLVGDNIPLGARIVGVADAVDVMLSGRAYSPPRSIDEVIAEVGTERGRQFDPACADAAIALLGSEETTIELRGAQAAPLGLLTGR